MAPETKKRKGAADAAPKPKKQKKADEKISKNASKKALSAAVQPLDDIAVKVKAPRKRASDFMDDGATTIPEPAKQVKKSKKSQGTDDTEEALKAGKRKSSSKEKDSVPQLVDEAEETEAEEEDDQTAALLAGFESDRDESDPENDDAVHEDELAASIPEKARLALAAASKGKDEDEPGVIFVGRIPHGFYEPQMKAYFKQFGKVTRLRLSRSKKTGASKHYAFVEFASAEVADIVARTMNNYLMFGHILQCKVVPTEQVHPKLFDGSKGRFKRMPRNKIAGAQMARGAERDVWEKRVQKENKRRSLRNKALKAQLGYEYQAPEVKAVSEVPKKALATIDAAAQQLLLEAPAGEISLVNAESHPDGVTITETVKAKKSKKGAKDAKGDADTDAAEIVEKVTEKRGRKGKSTVVTETEEVEITPVAKEGSKVKQTRSKSVKANGTANGATPEKRTTRKTRASM